MSEPMPRIVPGQRLPPLDGQIVPIQIEVVAPSIDHIVNLLPRHKCALFITHNEHLNEYGETIARKIAGRDGTQMPILFEGPDHMKRAIETNELWEMQWYPDTPIGSYCVAAPTFADLIRFANTIPT